MKTFNLSIHTAERDFYNGECESLVIPVYDGMYGIMAGHSDMIGAIETGDIEITVPGKDKECYVISRGMVKVEDGNVIILADSILSYEEYLKIDETKKEEDIDEKKMSEKAYKEYLHMEMEMRRAVYRLKNKKSDNDLSLR